MEVLGAAEPLTPPELVVDPDGTVRLLVHESATRFAFYRRDASGWHATHIDVPGLSKVGTMRLPP